MCGGAVLAIDGRVVHAVNEERLNREKLSTGFPARSISHVLTRAGVRPEQVDEVRVADEHNYYKPDSKRWQGWLVDESGKGKGLMYRAASLVSRFLGSSDLAQRGYYALRRTLTRGRRGKVRARLREEFGFRCPVSFVDHHLAHALAAYYTAGHREATVITLDGGGDGLCSRVYRVRDGRFELLHRTRSYDSIGNYYAYVTHLCGFTAHKHEGKITGLAATGQPAYKSILERFISYQEGEIRNTGNAYFWSAVRKLEDALPADFSRPDLAASMQRLLEEVVSRFCDHWARESGFGNLALAGGVFANVRLNQFVHELPSADRVFVHPGMGDEGLAFGAALRGLASVDHEGDEGHEHAVAASNPIQDVFLGPEFPKAEIYERLRDEDLEVEEPEDPERRVAELLVEGRVVARFDGRMEYGPRALGNRSILYRPDDPSVNDWLNEKLRRTEFMPFAPIVKEDLASACFRDLEGAEHTAEFMTITFDCSDWMKETCPGVVHVDGSARPQIVRRRANPGLYRILDEYYRLTKLPALINTSFNVHEEPIVCTPDDAVQGLLAADLDVLAAGPYVAFNSRTARPVRTPPRERPARTARGTTRPSRQAPSSSR